MLSVGNWGPLVAGSGSSLLLGLLVIVEGAVGRDGKRKVWLSLNTFCGLSYCCGFQDGPQPLLLSCLGPLKPNSAFLRCCDCEPEPGSPLSMFSSKFGLLGLLLMRNPPQTSLQYGKRVRSARSSCLCVSLRNGTPLVF